MDEFVKTIDLEDGSYIVADEITIDNTIYVYLNNEKDLMDFCIRKVTIDDNQEYLIGLDNKSEFDKALQVFVNKHKQELEIY